MPPPSNNHFESPLEKSVHSRFLRYILDIPGKQSYKIRLPFLSVPQAILEIPKIAENAEWDLKDRGLREAIHLSVWILKRVGVRQEHLENIRKRVSDCEYLEFETLEKTGENIYTLRFTLRPRIRTNDREWELSQWSQKIIEQRLNILMEHDTMESLMSEYPETPEIIENVLGLYEPKDIQNGIWELIRLLDISGFHPSGEVKLIDWPGKKWHPMEALSNLRSWDPSGVKSRKWFTWMKVDEAGITWDIMDELWAIDEVSYPSFTQAKEAVNAIMKLKDRRYPKNTSNPPKRK